MDMRTLEAKAQRNKNKSDINQLHSLAKQYHYYLTVTAQSVAVASKKTSNILNASGPKQIDNVRQCIRFIRKNINRLT